MSIHFDTVEEMIAAQLTDEDVDIWHNEAAATENVHRLVEKYGAFSIWGSRTGSEPLTVQMQMQSPADAEEYADEIFGKVISRYTRAQALEDGFLVDVTATANEAGIKWPVALTTAVWSLIETIPPSRSFQDVQGRLWDVLWMAYCAMKRGGSGTILLYRLILDHMEKRESLNRKGQLVSRQVLVRYVTLKIVSGPGDSGEPVLTIMLPDED